MYASQKVQVFSSLRRPETHSGHREGHQRASTITGSFNIIQSTNITVNRVENQKTNTFKKMENGLIVFQQ